jgi:uncharacterized protein (DUF1330 family)
VLVRTGDVNLQYGAKLQEIKMTVYVIADIKVTDDGWIPAYAASVHELVHKHGGRYLSRSRNVKTLEGKPLDSTFIAILEFPSAEAVQALTTYMHLPQIPNTLLTLQPVRPAVKADSS